MSFERYERGRIRRMARLHVTRTLLRRQSDLELYFHLMRTLIG